MSASELGLGTHKLCEPCAKDTAVYGRCERLDRINKPGTICDRCLRDGRLLVSYRVCCEPERRHGHTDACRKARKKAADPVLQRFAVALFSTDTRILTLVGHAFGGVFDAQSGQCLALEEGTVIERVGRAWELAADGHEPEATYRKEAEDRAFRMQAFDRELSRYAAETKRLTRESKAQEAVKNVAQANARLAPPLPHAEHQANLAKHQAEEMARRQEHADRAWETKKAEDKQKRAERAERRSVYVKGRAKVVTQDPAPAGDLMVYTKSNTNPESLRVHGVIEKNAIVDVLDTGPEVFLEFELVSWRGGSRYPKITGYVRQQYLVDIAEEGPATIPVLDERPLKRDPRIEPAFGTSCDAGHCGLCGMCKLTP